MFTPASQSRANPNRNPILSADVIAIYQCRPPCSSGCIHMFIFFTATTRWPLDYLKKLQNRNIKYKIKYTVCEDMFAFASCEAWGGTRMSRKFIFYILFRFKRNRRQSKQPWITLSSAIIIIIILGVIDLTEAPVAITDQRDLCREKEGGGSNAGGPWVNPLDHHHPQNRVASCGRKVGSPACLTTSINRWSGEARVQRTVPRNCSCTEATETLWRPCSLGEHSSNKWVIRRKILVFPRRNISKRVRSWI